MRCKPGGLGIGVAGGVLLVRGLISVPPGLRVTQSQDE